MSKKVSGTAFLVTAALATLFFLIGSFRAPALIASTPLSLVVCGFLRVWHASLRVDETLDGVGVCRGSEHRFKKPFGTDLC
jgi:hypothetical protein